jgi:hypothetical protein
MPGQAVSCDWWRGGAISTAADLPYELFVDAPLAEELGRHGVHLHAGDRLRLQRVAAQRVANDQLWDAFIGSFESDEPDLAERSEEILRAEFGRQ